MIWEVKFQYFWGLVGFFFPTSEFFFHALIIRQFIRTISLSQLHSIFLMDECLAS